ncbi:MAG: DUF3810 domain-containing protein [Oscillospiraceae bacterium]|nr:DUF3810 domain-containing protein [Oscillospiraceae bacterium]
MTAHQTTRAKKIFRPLLYRRAWFGLLAVPAFVLAQLAHAFPAAVEHTYSRAVYPVLSRALGRLTGALPFSVSEILIYIAVTGGIAYLVYEIRGIAVKQKQRRRVAARLISTLLCIGGLWYFLFIVMCGLNYYRQPLSEYEHIGLEVRESTVDELAALCAELADTVNGLREMLPEDENGVMATGFASYYEGAAFAGSVFGNIGRDYPIFGGFVPKPKPVFSSLAMSHMNIVGVFVPFTYEANVNVHIPDYAVPSAMMHELAHFKGFMREDEANFISWMACRGSGSDEFHYSGAMLAFAHCTNALYSADRGLYVEVMAGLSEKVRRDLAHNSAYWRRFDGPVSDASTAVNNTYLRANRQSDGVKSYGRMVDLLLAEFRGTANA